MRNRQILLWLGFMLCADLFGQGTFQEAFYHGEKACRACHSGEKGTSFSAWRLSAHSRAYASLSRPESREIARLSGIYEDPYQSPVCLGCHATASDALSWQIEPGFRIEDGMQCEVCHGPGSRHVDQPKVKLRIPDESFCMICHLEKKSHTKVLGPTSYDYKTAMKSIHHEMPKDEPPAILPVKNQSPSSDDLQETQFAGVDACLKCHVSSKTSSQFGAWRMSPHARAFASLQTGKPCTVLGQSQTDDQRTCLPCHSTGYGEALPLDFDLAQGVQCESCHGPRGQYAKNVTESNQAKHGPTRPITPETCTRCHKEKGFDFESSVKKVSHEKKELPAESLVEYKTPNNLTLTRNGKRLFTACEASDSVVVSDARTGTILAEIKVENLPHDVCLSPDERLAFVSNRGTDFVSIIDTQSYRVTGRIEVGDEPHGLVTDQAGTYLYVVNSGSNDISVVDISKSKEIKRLSAARGAWGIQRSHDGKHMFVTNNLSHFVKFRTPCLSEVTVIDTEKAIVSNRYFLPETNMVEGIAFAPDDSFALVTLIRTKNLVPMTRVMQGWVMTNGFAVIWKDGRIDQLLLDEMNSFFADPTDIAITPDGAYAYVTGGGVGEVAVIDLIRLKEILQHASDYEREVVFPNHLGLACDFVVKRIPVGLSPRGLTVSPDGTQVFVANGLSDSITVIDVASQKAVDTFDLGTPDVITLQRRGEQVFHSAEVTFGRQFSCHSCHPDGGIDGITYDIEPDGLGLNPVDNRTLKGIQDTAPFKWTGKNPTLSRQCGPRLAVFFTRIDPFTPDQVEALDHYICTIPRNPNRYRVEGERTHAQENGKKIFERQRNNAGAEIPHEGRCITCHPGPYFTSRKMADMGQASELDTQSSFDIPHLNNIYESAPYLHDGRADTLEEIWTRFNPHDTHGVTNDLTKDQLKDLIEYLKTL